jgi:hypothetical protein
LGIGLIKGGEEAVGSGGKRDDVVAEAAADDSLLVFKEAGRDATHS